MTASKQSQDRIPFHPDQNQDGNSKQFITMRGHMNVKHWVRFISQHSCFGSALSTFTQQVLHIQSSVVEGRTIGPLKVLYQQL